MLELNLMMVILTNTHKQGSKTGILHRYYLIYTLIKLDRNLK